jgi:hypothetical protein
MSEKSDLFEKAVSNNINKISNLVEAKRPKVGTEYSDVLLEYKNKKTWLEVKMSHTDNLSNPRVYYENGQWKTTYTTPVALHTVKILNQSKEAKDFIKEISKFSGIPENIISIPTTKSGLKKPGAVPLEVMKLYFSKPNVNRYITNIPNQDIGEMVTEHYIKGKKEPAYYMQAGDDFYRISNKNPYGLDTKIPLLTGIGDFKVRISTRSEFYEVQAEIKIKNMPASKYSVSPKTKKLNPFDSLK